MNHAQKNTRSIAVVLTLAVIGTLLVLALSGSGDAGTSHAAPSASTSASERAAAGRAVARAHVAALRRPRSATRDALPPTMLGSPLLSDGALDVATARRVSVDDTTGWVASSGDGQDVCALVDGALGCTALTTLVDEGMTPSIMGRAGEPHQVFGVAADGVSDIELVHQDDRAEAVSITDGFYLIASDDWPKELTWLGPDGAESFTFPTR
jgi:hypothetical protein